MHDNNSLAHTSWNCKYHIVFAPKYRRKIFYGQNRAEIGKILRELCDWKGVHIVEAEVCPDHTEPILIKKDLVNICTSPIEQKYVDLEQIGHGSYATVYSYTDPFYNRKYVLKRAKNNLSGKELERFRQEYYQMAQLSSPYIRSLKLPFVPMINSNAFLAI